MRKVSTLLALLCIISIKLFAQYNACSQWTWVKGGPGASDAVYGSKGVGSTSNRPGGRDGSAFWRDANGRLWLFGGGGYGSGGASGFLNDVWRFDPASNQWAWMQGSSSVNEAAVYGTKGVAAAANTPGGRSFAAVWQSSDGTLWLYGGNAHSAAYGEAYPTDLWKYSVSTNQWTWMGGSTSATQAAASYAVLGVAAAANNPGSRSGSSSWVDASGKLWLFGGYNGAGSALNDLWNYDPATGYWTAVQSNGYAASKPAVRYHAAEWKDSQGNLWLFGGYGTAGGNGSFGDIWKYSIASNQWTLVKGTAALAAPAQYGTQGVASAANTPGSRYAGASWTDGQHFWFFGGYKETAGEGPYNDLWKYDPAANSWTWVKGDNVPYGASVYGTKGVAASANKPGGRYLSAWWVDNAANFWIMGGFNNSSFLNDLWKLATNTGVQTTYYQDYDKDGFGNPNVSKLACSQPVGYVADNKDCNDRSNVIYPGAPEICDKKDNDCDGLIDEGLAIQTYYKDYDKDGYGSSYKVEACSQPAGYVMVSGDCNDGNATVYPNAPELCDGFDNDCDGVVDDGLNLTTFYRDYDKDGYGTTATTKQACATPVGYVSEKGDCNDNNKAINPGAAEVCNGIDDNCDGITDNGVTTVSVSSQWTWVKGGPGASDAVYGSKGVGSTSNRPGGRDGSAFWRDANGRLWLFGGGGYGSGGASGFLNDVWRFDPASNQWAWMQGSSSVNEAAVYGTKGVAAAANTPGGRSFAAVWQSSDGTLWLYGGNAHSAAYGEAYPTDLWKYSVSTNQWTWMGGSTSATQAAASYAVLGVAAAANNPGSRSGSSSWVDASGKLWLFGGYNGAGSALNDLWNYDPATGYWTAVQSNGYAASKPAVRYHAAEWKDSQGNLWLFGGYGTAGGNGSFGDIWKYSIASNQWTLVKGTAALAAPAQYGTQGVASAANTPGSRYAGASWTDGQHFWFFGGYKETAGEGPYNDLWKYDPAANSWTWVKGDNVPYGASVYGTKGVAASANKPGGRYLSAWWVDNAANFWIMGGFNNSSFLNDLWKLATNTGVQTTYYQDYDKDGFGNAALSITTTCAAPVGYVINNTDCNDRNAAINPAKAEVIGNGIDDDCDGQKDEPAVMNTLTNTDRPALLEAASSLTLTVSAVPNPASYYFTLSMKSNSSKPAQLRLINEVGQVLEVRSNITPNNTYNVGQTFRPGIYYAEVIQEGKRATVKLIKVASF
jgi:N-acetylneuraminic acid mutarotase